LARPLLVGLVTAAQPRDVDGDVALLGDDAVHLVPVGGEDLLLGAADLVLRQHLPVAEPYVDLLQDAVDLVEVVGLEQGLRLLGIGVNGQKRHTSIVRRASSRGKSPYPNRKYGYFGRRHLSSVARPPHHLSSKT